jgi:hypothetical protein
VLLINQSLAQEKGYLSVSVAGSSRAKAYQLAKGDGDRSGGMVEVGWLAGGLAK